MIVGSALVLPSWSSPSGSEAGREDTMAGSKLAPSSIRERERGVRAGSQGGIRDGGGLEEREGVEGRGGEGWGREGWGGEGRGGKGKGSRRVRYRQALFRHTNAVGTRGESFPMTACMKCCSDGEKGCTFSLCTHLTGTTRKGAETGSSLQTGTRYTPKTVLPQKWPTLACYQPA